ncbi:MAG: Fur family transcriptional regulator [Burkholderiales bacterium]
MAPAVSSDPNVHRLRSMGARVTSARVAVLDVLTRSDRALTHREIEDGLAGMRVDRVTVYRVLEWLTSEGLAHRIADDDRVTRFSAAGESDHGHAHFKCSACGGVYCIPTGPALKLRLPAGFRAGEIELTIKGTCAHCPA